jgi:hypothetical protein
VPKNTHTTIPPVNIFISQSQYKLKSNINVDWLFQEAFGRPNTLNNSCLSDNISNHSVNLASILFGIHKKLRENVNYDGYATNEVNLISYCSLSTVKSSYIF